MLIKALLYIKAYEKGTIFLWKAQKQDALLVKVVHKEMALKPPGGGIVVLRQDEMCISIICFHEMIHD